MFVSFIKISKRMSGPKPFAKSSAPLRCMESPIYGILCLHDIACGGDTARNECLDIGYVHLKGDHCDNRSMTDVASVSLKCIRRQLIDRQLYMKLCLVCLGEEVDQRQDRNRMRRYTLP